MRLPARVALFVLVLLGAKSDGTPFLPEGGDVQTGYAQSPFPYRLGLQPSDTAGTLRVDPTTLGSGLSGSSFSGSVDLSAQFPPIGTQGDQESCVGWAVSYVKGYQETRDRGTPADRAQFSPAFIYNQCNSGRDAGCSVADALRITQRIGAVPFAEFPYDQNDYQRQPSQETLQRAASYRAAGFGRLWGIGERPNVNDVRQALATNEAVILGIRIYDNAGTREGPVIIGPRPSDALIGGHAVVAVGYDDSAQLFKIANSWGTGWGDEGFGYLTYDFVERGDATEAWVMINAPRSVADSVARIAPGNATRLTLASSVFLGEQQWIVVSSPDSKLLATTGSGLSMMLWDANSGRLIRNISDVGVLTYPLFSPDGRLLGGYQRTTAGRGVGLWDIATGNYLRHVTGITGLEWDFSPDGTKIAASGGEGNPWTLWEVATGRSLPAPSQQWGASGVKEVRFSSPDGAWLAAASGTTVELRHLQLDFVYRREAVGPVRNLVFSRTGLLAWVAGGNEVTLHRVAQDDEFDRTIGIGHNITDIEFSPDGGLLAVATDMSIRLIETATLREIAVLNHPDAVRSVTFTPDGRQLISLAVGESLCSLAAGLTPCQAPNGLSGQRSTCAADRLRPS